VFLDVKVAFATMIHRQSLDGVLEAKIRSRLLAFSLSFLDDKDMKINFGKATSSNLIHRKRGVPQGPVLGPIYYNLSEFNIPLELEMSEWVFLQMIIAYGLLVNQLKM